MKTAGKVIGASIAALFFTLLAAVATAVTWLALYDWNRARGWIGEQVLERTGRALAIEGRLEVRPFSLKPGLSAESVTFANADWGEPRPMLQARSVTIALDLRRLLRGEIVLPLVELDNADVLLQREGDGRRNWILKSPEQSREGRSPRIERLVVNDSRVRVMDRMTNSDVAVTAQSQPAQEIHGLRVTVRGRVRGVRLEGEGDSGGLLQLMDENAPYPLRFEGTLGESRFSAKGSFTGVGTLQSLDVEMTIAGGNLAPLGEVLEISLPHTKPYRLSGLLERRGSEWHFRGFRGTVGASDLEGDFSVSTAGARPRLAAQLRSNNLDIADLGGFVGTRPGHTEKTRAPGRLLPSEPIELEKLQRVDARVRLVANRFRNADKLPLESLDATLSLENGVLKFDPVLFGVAQGSVRSTVSVDARKPTLAASVDTRFSNLLLSRLIPAAKKLDESIGALNGRLRLAGRGNSPARQLASSSGRIDLYSTGGETSNLLMELAGADIAEALKFWVGGDRKVQLRCAILSFGVKDGLAVSDVVVVDTDDTIIGGEGKVSFDDEALDLKLVPLPKDMSILSLRGPLRVSGSFAKPSLGLEKGNLARKIGASVLLGLVNPIAAMLPLIETGPGEDAPCADLVASVEKAAGVREAARRRR